MLDIDTDFPPLMDVREENALKQVDQLVVIEFVLLIPIDVYVYKTSLAAFETKLCPIKFRRIFTT